MRTRHEDTLPARGHAARHRPGDDRHDVPRLRPRGRAARAAPTASSPSTSRSPGWVEHDAAEIWDVTHAVAGEALDDAGVGPGELDAVGITNQRETVVVLGPRDGRAAAPRARLAGPPHRRALRRAARRTGHEPRSARQDRPRARPVLQRAPRSSGCCATSTASTERARDGRAVFGTIDSLADLQAHRRARDRPAQRVAHDAVRHRHAAAGTTSCCELLRRARAVAARGPPELRRARPHDGRRASTATRSPSRASPATSRPRCSASAAWSPGWARTPTAPARSCC